MKLKKLNLLILAAVTTLVGHSQAATIIYSTKAATTTGSGGTATLNSGLFTTTGGFLRAVNFGGSTTSFDGIDFSTGTSNTPFASGITTDLTLFTTNYTSYGSAVPVASNGRYAGSGAGTVTLGGLTLGQAYRFQALLFDNRGGSNGRTVRFDGINRGIYGSSATNGSGLLVSGEFVADATSQAFTIEAFKSDGSSAGPQINALTLYTIPEPGTAMLISLAGISLLLLRRRS